MKDLYTENYKALLKQIKDTRHKQIKTQINYLWIGRLNIVKMSVLPKVIYRIQPMQSIPRACFTEIEKNPKINMKAQEITNSQNNL